MNSTELLSFVRKAICCAGNKGKQVADMFLNGDKCAEKELTNLVLLSDAITALDCYRADVETENCEIVQTGNNTNAQFTLLINCTTIPMGALVTFYTSDGTTITYTVVDALGETLSSIMVFQIISALPAGYTATLTDGDCTGDGLPETYTIVAPCNISSINLNYTYSDFDGLVNTTINGENTVPGECAYQEVVCTTTTTEYTNCLTDAGVENLVALVTKICDTCNCD